MAHAHPMPPAFADNIHIIAFHDNFIIIAVNHIGPHEITEIFTLNDKLLTILLGDLQMLNTFTAVTVDDGNVLDIADLIPMKIKRILDILEAENSFSNANAVNSGKMSKALPVRAVYPEHSIIPAHLRSSRRRWHENRPG